MRKPSFKDRIMKNMVSACIESFNNKDSEFYHNGKPRTGAGHRCYFWNGYYGTGDHPGSGTAGYACYRAGEYCKEHYNG